MDDQILINRQRKAEDGLSLRIGWLNSQILLFFLRALLVGNRAGRFACRLAARLALAARGVFARLDAGLLNSLNMLHD